VPEAFDDVYGDVGLAANACLKFCVLGVSDVLVSAGTAVRLKVLGLAVTQLSSKARLLDSSRWASAWARRVLAFCSTVWTASAPATKRTGGSF
jgi:hypothetical protein